MNIPPIISQLHQALSHDLPGKTAHDRLSPLRRFPADMSFPDPSKARRNAVLLLLYLHDNGEVFIALMQRAIDGHVHSGQISFPGGGVEPNDVDLVHTALRETKEEFGFDTSSLQVLGQLTPVYIPVSNSWVQPVVAFNTHRPTFQPDEKEVAGIIEIPIVDFLHPEAITEAQVRSGMGYSIQVPCFSLHGHTIWGATSMMLNEFLTVFRKIAI